jgi:hypothetical protein
MLRSKRIRRRYFGLLYKLKREKKLKDPQIFPILFIFSSKKYFCKEIDITNANAALTMSVAEKKKVKKIFDYSRLSPVPDPFGDHQVEMRKEIQ